MREKRSSKLVYTLSEYEKQVEVDRDDITTKLKLFRKGLVNIAYNWRELMKTLVKADKAKSVEEDNCTMWRN